MNSCCCWLNLVSAPSHEVCERRCNIAAALLGMDACCLHSDSAWSNVHIVLLKRYWDEWRIVRDTGRCPGRLFASVLMIRCQMEFDTQDREGLTVSYKGWPRHSLHSDRLMVQFGFGRLWPIQFWPIHFWPSCLTSQFWPIHFWPSCLASQFWPIHFWPKLEVSG